MTTSQHTTNSENFAVMMAPDKPLYYKDPNAEFILRTFNTLEDAQELIADFSDLYDTSTWTTVEIVMSGEDYLSAETGEDLYELVDALARLEWTA